MKPFTLLKIALGTLVVVFLVAPILAILPLAFTDSVFLSYPVQGFSGRWFEELMFNDAWRRSIVNSLIIGSGATVIATVLGTMAALGLRGDRVPLAGLWRTSFILPMVVPPVVLGVGMQILYVRLGLASTYLGVMIAHAVLAIPFVVVTVSTSLAGIDRAIERSALSLGASPSRTFLSVTLPLAMPGVVSGAVFAFAISLDEVILTLFVAGPDQRTLARQMFSTIRENISPAVASAALVLIVGTLVFAGLAGILRMRQARRTRLS